MNRLCYASIRTREPLDQQGPIAPGRTIFENRTSPKQAETIFTESDENNGRERGVLEIIECDLTFAQSPVVALLENSGVRLLYNY
uniref:Uncharacterized protein n=1 Tax=Romanomermis culicivorax TaxID=13658 RepID=A0A915ILE9_ROMCU